jgi:hypothetical protein
MYSYYNSNYLYYSYTWQLSYMKTFLFVNPINTLAGIDRYINMTQSQFRDPFKLKKSY